MARTRNRKTGHVASRIESVDDVPLAQPNRNARETKTLLQLVEDKRAELTGEAPTPANKSEGSRTEFIHTKINADGSLSSIDAAEVEKNDPVGALGNAILYGLSLAMIHFTLDVLVHNQYAERFEWSSIASRAGVAMLIMMLVVYIMHPNADALWAQSVFLAGSIAAGCYLIHVSSTFSYFAVMKQAPPLGVLWIYSVFEQRLEVSLIGLAVVGGYFWWGGYTIF